jgi:hypothetical protein
MRALLETVFEEFKVKTCMASRAWDWVLPLHRRQLTYWEGSLTVYSVVGVGSTLRLLSASGERSIPQNRLKPLPTSAQPFALKA